MCDLGKAHLNGGVVYYVRVEDKEVIEWVKARAIKKKTSQSAIAGIVVKNFVKDRIRAAKQGKVEDIGYSNIE